MVIPDHYYQLTYYQISYLKLIPHTFESLRRANIDEAIAISLQVYMASAADIISTNSLRSHLYFWNLSYDTVKKMLSVVVYESRDCETNLSVE